jgi:hypothetical protein
MKPSQKSGVLYRSALTPRQLSAPGASGASEPKWRMLQLAGFDPCKAKTRKLKRAPLKPSNLQ